MRSTAVIGAPLSGARWIDSTRPGTTGRAGAASPETAGSPRTVTTRSVAVRHDERPRQRPRRPGIGLFSIGLLIGGLAPAMPGLVAARVIQGFGAGAIPAVAYVSIGRALPEALRPRMFATLSTAWVVPGVIGPSLAGIVAESLH